MQYSLDGYMSTDAPCLNRLALAAFAQYQKSYPDWKSFASRIAHMSELAKNSDIIVARAGSKVVGAVAYVPPYAERADFYQQAWAVMRMLVVDPACRGQGIGRALADECIRRARLDRAPVVALHTSPIMTVALAMYRHMGFEFVRDAPPVCGVPYGLFLLPLEQDSSH